MLDEKIEEYNRTPGIFFRVCSQKEDVFTYRSTFSPWFEELIEGDDRAIYLKVDARGKFDDGDEWIQYVYEGVCCAETLDPIIEVLNKPDSRRDDAHECHILVMTGHKFCELFEEDGVLITPTKIVDTLYFRYVDNEVVIYQ